MLLNLLFALRMISREFIPLLFTIDFPCHGCFAGEGLHRARQHYSESGTPLTLFSYAGSKLFFIFTNFLVLKVRLPILIWVQISYMTVPKKSELEPHSVQEQSGGRSDHKVCRVCPGCSAFWVQWLRCALFSDGTPRNEEQEGWAVSEAALLTEVTRPRALPYSLQINLNSQTIFTHCRAWDDFT